MTPDHINGLFECVGGVVLCKNIKAILRDKKLSGVSWWPVFFFATWGLWNLYYYPYLEQWWSFAGGIIVAAANWTWLVLVAYYYYTLRRKNFN